MPEDTTMEQVQEVDVSEEQKAAEALRKKENDLVGKPVRYFSKAEGDTPHAATIASAKYDPESDAALVNLAVYEPSGQAVNKTDVPFVQKDGEKKAHEELDQFCVAAT